MMKRVLLALLITGVSCSFVSSAPSVASATTARVSVATGGAEANERSGNPVATPDGRFAVFTSAASNLVPGDDVASCDSDGDNIYDDNCFDVFVHDRQTGATERISVDGSGNQANDWSWGAGISDDGRYVGFVSYATNLVPGDTNNRRDVFVKDRQTGAIERANVDSLGAQAESAYEGSSIAGLLSADGRFVAFTSAAANLVAGDTNNSEDVFIKDRQTGAVERVSLDSSETQAFEPSYLSDMSPDARFVVFSSRAQMLAPGDTLNFSDIFVRDRLNGVTTRVSVNSSGQPGTGESWHGVISDDGRYVFINSAARNFGTDPNSPEGVFRHDREVGTTEVVSLNSAGEPSNGQSGSSFWINGLTFGKYANGLNISGDGRYVAFQSDGLNLVSPDDNSNLPDIYVRDLVSEKTVRVSVNSNGEQGNERSYSPYVSGGGRYIVFTSTASNLTSDTNSCAVPIIGPLSCPDIFFHDLGDNDSDEHWNPFDNCVSAPNLDQNDGDSDGVGDICDNCPATPNLAQTDSDGDGAGNACDGDDDDDGLVDLQDNCPTVSNLTQEDFDVDGDGDACDNCPIDPNPDQADADSDLVGDICDSDPDGDGLEGPADPCPTVNDCDDDGLSDGSDNCRLIWNPGQPDEDGDLAGDECDYPGTGNVDCSGFPGVSAVDALKVLRHVAGLPVSQSEPCLDIGLMLPSGWALGDVNCSGGPAPVNSVDALLILRVVADLPVSLPGDCPFIKLY